MLQFIFKISPPTWLLHASVSPDHHQGAHDGTLPKSQSLQNHQPKHIVKIVAVQWQCSGNGNNSKDVFQPMIPKRPQPVYFQLFTKGLNPEISDLVTAVARFVVIITPKYKMSP